MIADRFGTVKTLILGAAFYAVGLLMMGQASNPLSLSLSAGLLMGLGISGSAFFLVLSAFARLLPETMRPIAFGVGTAAGSLGQLIFSVLGQNFIDLYGWQNALSLLALCLIVVPLLAFPLKGSPRDKAHMASESSALKLLPALKQAFDHHSYLWLICGFFVCGFHVAFITTHFPAYVPDQLKGGQEIWIGSLCLTFTPEQLGAYAIGLIGGFNIIGALVSGYLCCKMRQSTLLSLIYFTRGCVYTAFLLMPVTPWSILIFSGLAGLLWLSTIPPTQGLVVKMFGIRYMATLYGFVFFSHQIGAFFGVWFGGLYYAYAGSYEAVWWMAVALAFLASLAHLPIEDKPAQGEADPIGPS